jgi:hypothetical protein
MADSLLSCFSHIAVVAHDAGGAEIVSGYIKRNNLKKKCRFSLQGPATQIFINKLGAINNESITEVLPKCDCLFSATSWDSSHEYQAIKLAKVLDIKTIAFLDHWVNYSQRFTRGREEILPDEIWISDEYGLELAKNAFGQKIRIIRVVENPYLIEASFMLNEASKKKLPGDINETGNKALFISEAISEHALRVYGDERYWGYTQLEALYYLMDNIDALGMNIQNLRIRPHPSECPEKFLNVSSQSQIKIELSVGTSLWEDIAWSSIVLGCNSMAMAASLGSKRRVVCVIPPSGGLCKLPQAEIESLSKIIELD